MGPARQTEMQDCRAFMEVCDVMSDMLILSPLKDRKSSLQLKGRTINLRPTQKHAPSQKNNVEAKS